MGQQGPAPERKDAKFLTQTASAWLFRRASFDEPQNVSETDRAFDQLVQVDTDILLR
jgi:hypothetical protein